MIYWVHDIRMNAAGFRNFVQTRPIVQILSKGGATLEREGFLLMKKSMKKWLSVVALLLAAGSVTACSQNPSGSISSTPSSSAAESSDAEKEPVTLKYINYGSKPETGDCDRVWEKFNEMLLAEKNCTVDVEYLGSGDVAQLKLKFASNEDFDFCYTADWWGFYENAQSNAFLELTDDLLKENMPYTYGELPNIAWKQSSVGGKIYMVPHPFASISNIVVGYRGDLLSKYGMSDLQTLDDLEAYLEKVSENEPGMIATALEGMANLYLNYKNGWNSGNAADWNYKISETESPEMFFTVMKDGYMDYAKKMREFYEKGFWTSDMINDTTTVWDLFSNGTTATLMHNSGTVESKCREITAEHPDWDLKMFNPYKGTDVVRAAYNSDGWTLNRTTKHADKVLQTIDFIYSSTDAQKLLVYGFEGDSYVVEDGYVVPLDGVSADKQHNLGCNWNMPNYSVQKTFVKETHYPGYEEIYSDMESHVVENPLQAFVFDSSSVTTELANISAVVSANNALNYGMVEDVEGAVEKFRSDLVAAGYETVKAEYDRQIADFLSTYKK